MDKCTVKTTTRGEENIVPGSSKQKNHAFILSLQENLTKLESVFVEMISKNPQDLYLVHKVL